ncbi:MAG TPA: ATP-binding protein [Vicinamibacterales bacterium]|nr:ATP-binding protein [Vicinamibacterales bacterium]
MEPVTLLIIEDDQVLVKLLALNARLRDYATQVGATIDDARRALAAGPFQVALVDLTLGGESGLDVLRAIKQESPDTEIVVISATTSLASAIASYELKAFAFVPKPFDVDQLFSTVERALEHRRVVLANRRLVWEQRLINDVGEELRNLLPPEELAERVLQRLMEGLSADSSAARLLNPATGEYDLRVVSAPPEMRLAWSVGTPVVPRPSDRVLQTRAPIIIDDLHDGLDPDIAARLPIRSALSVPMFAGDVLIGALTVGSTKARRFSPEDQRLIATIANQTAVAIQNARLHTYVRIGKQEWEATFDAIADPIGVFSRDGRLLRGNAALSAYLNRPVTSLRGLSCDEIGLCAGQFPDCAVGRAAGTCCVHEEITRPDDHIFTVTTCPVLNANDSAAIVQIAKDVTREIRNARRMRQMSEEIAAANERLVATVDRLKTTQAQLLQAEKLSAIGQLVAGVAHELNNPLTSVIGYAQLLQEEVRETSDGDALPIGPQLRHDLRRIAEESERAAKIVRNLLAFARRQSAERAPQDIADVVSRVLSLRAYEFRLNAIELETDFEPGLPPVLGDGGQLQQALLNLVLNAEQAMRSRPVRRIRVGARHIREADAVELVISDSGHGIPDEILRRIFDPFFTTREVGEGTGLGLSICYGIVRDHGGQISVESRVGQGTTFKVLLPARAAAPAEPLRALVAHHDTTERDYVAAALTGWGHAVVAAETTADAFARLGSGRFDVALIDETLLAGGADRPEGPMTGARPALVLMTEAAGDGGVHPPFELAALKTALCGVIKEYV